jgi:hypothetical protein
MEASFGSAHIAAESAAGGAPTRASEPARVRDLRAGFAAALRAQPFSVHDESYSFAGRAVRLRVVGEELGARTHRAFRHLRRTDPGTEPVLRIDLWDETETGIDALPEAAATELERQWLACEGTLTASPDGRYVSFRFQDSVSVLDRHAQHLVGCRRNGSFLTGGEYSKPLLLMLSIWYHDQRVQLLHTGLIAHQGQGILVPGESGTGKSTTSLAGLIHGLEFLGDDFIGLERNGSGGFTGHSLFSTACIVKDNLVRFPELRPHVVEDELAIEQKPILFLAELFPERVRASVPVRAIVLLRVGHERTQLRPARRAEALHSLAASTLHTVVPRPGREALQLLGELAERLPAYWLLLGPDLRDIPAAIARIVDQVHTHGA